MTAGHSNQDNRSTPSEASQNDCDLLKSLLPAYTIGATDPDETRLVEELLPLCPEVADEMESYGQLRDALLFTVPVAEPPQHLRQAVLAAAGNPAQPAQPKPVPVLSPRPSMWESVKDVLFGSRARVATAVTGISLVVLVGSNLYWLNQVEALRERERNIQALLQQQNQMLASFGQRDTQRVELAHTEAGVETAQAVVYWQQENEVSLFTTEGLPPLTPDRTYELWLIRGEQAVGVGLFQVGSDGSGALIFNSDEPISEFDAIGVTEEPAGGSEAPTTTPILLGNI